MFGNADKYKLLCFIFIFGLLIRILFVCYLKEKLYWEDEFDYDRLAVQLIEDQVYTNEDGSPTAFRAPGYPIFLALNYLIFGHHFSSVRLVQAVFDCITLFLIFLIASQIFNQKVAIIAALLYAIYPLFIYTASTFFPTTFSIFLLALFIYFLIQSERKRTTIQLLLVGIVAGLSILTVPTFLVLILLAVVWLFFNLKRANQQAVRPISIIMLMMILTLSPWLIRNYRTFEKPLLIATNSGYNFWMGNNLWATPTSGNSIPFPEPLAAKLAQARSEVEQEKIFYQDAFQFIKNNPGPFLSLTVKKAINLWQLYPTPTTGYKMLPNLSKLMSLLTYGPIVLFAIGGFFIAWRRKRNETWLLGLLFISFTMGYAFFITKARFRLPLDPYLIILASVTLTRFWENRTKFFMLDGLNLKQLGNYFFNYER